MREAREETGLQVSAQHASGIYYEPALDLLIFVFLCRPKDGSFEDLHPDNDEISECAFWALDDLPLQISDFTIQRVKDAASGVSMPLPTMVPERKWLY